MVVVSGIAYPLVILTAIARSRHHERKEEEEASDE
jgi:hypothetical protein